MCVSQQSLEIPLKSSGHHIYTWKKHAVCLKHLPCFLYYYFLNSFRMSLRIQITCSDSWHCFCNRWWKLREWSNTVTAKPYLLQKPKDQKDALVFSSVKGKQRFGFFFLQPICVHAESCSTLCDPVDSRQVPLSIEFSKQEYWSGLPFPSPRDLPNPGIELESPVLPTLQTDFLLTKSSEKTLWRK